MGLKLENNARSTLAIAISSTETTIRVRVGHGVRFPVISEPDDWFPLALEDDSGNIEYLRATSRSGDIIAVQRGAEGSQPRAYAAGDVCELRLTKAAVEALGSDGGGGTPVVTPAASISDGVLGGGS